MHKKTGALSSTTMAVGQFYKPEVVLDNIARSAPTEEGVIEISARDVTGRIGVSRNSVIIGGVVDGTGETGITAICKLLLLPYGEYSFRKAVPLDQLHLQQELGLSFDEAKSFLQGPSSIGLACPADKVISSLKATQEVLQASKGTSGGFGWETTEFRATYVPTPSPAVVAEYIEAYGEAPESITGSYVHECNRLLDSFDKKRQEELQFLNAPRKTETEILIPGPLPTRKEKGPKVNTAWVYAAVVLMFGIAGFSIFNRPADSSSVFSQAQDETPVAVAQAEPAAADAPPKPSAAGNAPYALPEGNSNNAAPPSNPTPSETSEESPMPPAPPPPQLQGNNMEPAPIASQAGNQEVNRWMDAVRGNPSDANARRKLAYAYLTVGNAHGSLEQYYSVMRLEKVDASDIIQYADNMMVFCGRNSAKQFLTDFLRSDPQQSSIRQKLASL
ncbi:MAG: hypothetical protein SGJ27_16015 [Candidatus Melainabacteria bacterium]|nr:hypothetical protein [Candidatus Melainabacteria bacterium]